MRVASSWTLRSSSPTVPQNAGKTWGSNMYKAENRNQWHFDMKYHTVVNAGIDFLHTLKAPAANVHDVTVATKKTTRASTGPSPIWGIKTR